MVFIPTLQMRKHSERLQNRSHPDGAMTPARFSHVSELLIIVLITVWVYTNSKVRKQSRETELLRDLLYANCQAFYFLFLFEIYLSQINKWDLSVKKKKEGERPCKIPQHLKIICLLEISWLQYHEDVNGTDFEPWDESDALDQLPWALSALG